jgi:hypothetical protein
VTICESSCGMVSASRHHRSAACGARSPLFEVTTTLSASAAGDAPPERSRRCPARAQPAMPRSSAASSETPARDARCRRYVDSSYLLAALGCCCSWLLLLLVAATGDGYCCCCCCCRAAAVAATSLLCGTTAPLTSLNGLNDPAARAHRSGTEAARRSGVGATSPVTAALSEGARGRQVWARIRLARGRAGPRVGRPTAPLQLAAPTSPLHPRPLRTLLAPASLAPPSLPRSYRRPLSARRVTGRLAGQRHCPDRRRSKRARARPDELRRTETSAQRKPGRPAGCD